MKQHRLIYSANATAAAKNVPQFWCCHLHAYGPLEFATYYKKSYFKKGLPRRAECQADAIIVTMRDAIIFQAEYTSSIDYLGKPVATAKPERQTLTDAQIEQQSGIDDAIDEMLGSIIEGYERDWELICEVRDLILPLLLTATSKTEMELYPYLEPPAAYMEKFGDKKVDLSTYPMQGTAEAAMHDALLYIFGEYKEYDATLVFAALKAVKAIYFGRKN